MQYELAPETFYVEEIAKPMLKENGRYFYYLMMKKGLSHKKAEDSFDEKVYFSGRKDKNATTVQWVCSEQELEEANEEDFGLRFMGKCDEKLQIGAHKQNFFKVLAGLDKDEIKKLRRFRQKDEKVCNYFGEQRFDERVPEFADLIGKGGYENALKFFLTEESKFDSEKSTGMKELILKNWGRWKEIRESELIKGTGKERLFWFLENNEGKFKDAFGWAERKSLAMMLKAAQSLRFNEMLDRMARERKPKNFFAVVDIKERALAASNAFTRELMVEANEFEKESGLENFERKSFFIAEGLKLRDKEGLQELSFYLPKGSYATVFLIFLKERLKE